MKAIVISDVHIHSTTIDIVEKVVDRVIKEKKDEEYLIIAGYWFHKATNLSIEVLEVSKKLFDKLNKYFKIIMLAGNHDVTKRTVEKRNSPLFLYDFYKSAINNPISVDNIYFIPYTSSQEQFDEWYSLAPKNTKLIIAHQTFDIKDKKHKYLWFPLKEQSAILPFPDVITLRSSDIPILSGHIHTPLNYGAYYYLGSVYPLKRNEGNEHFIYRLNTDNSIQFTSIPVDFIKYYTLDRLDGRYNKENYILYITSDKPETEIRAFYNKVRAVNIERLSSIVDVDDNIELTTAKSMIYKTIENSSYSDIIKEKVKQIIFGG